MTEEQKKHSHHNAKLGEKSSSEDHLSQSKNSQSHHSQSSDSHRHSSRSEVHMRKHDEKKSSSLSFARRWLVVVIILALLVGAYFVFFHHESDDAYSTYNGFAFTKNGQYWMTSLERNGQPFEAPFYIHPKDLDAKNYSYDPLVTKLILSYPHTNFTIAVAPDEGSVPVLAGVDIARILGKFYRLPVKSALYVPLADRTNETQYSSPVKDCSDSTLAHPLIWITSKGNRTGVYFDDTYKTCIIVSGSVDTVDDGQSPLVELADLLSYKILRIMS